MYTIRHYNSNGKLLITDTVEDDELYLIAQTYNFSENEIAYRLKTENKIKLNGVTIFSNYVPEDLVEIKEQEENLNRIFEGKL